VVNKKSVKMETGRISELINNGELAGIERELGDCMHELERMKKALENKENGFPRVNDSSDVSE